MRQAERQTQSHLTSLFATHGIAPRNYLGQNFLIDLNLLEYIVESAELEPSDVVLEVGSGTGGMTAFLAEQAGHVVSVEVDPTMHKLASLAVEGFDNVTLLHCDALKNKNHFATNVLEEVDKQLKAEPDRKLKLVANLPYSIATPVVSNLVVTDLPWERMVITIQLELAERMIGRPGRSNYGALSVWLQSQCRIRLLKRLPPSVFWPRPKVNSAIVLLTPRPEAAKRIVDRPFFQDFVRRLFHQRRKLMRSVLVGMYRKDLDKATIDSLLSEMGFREQARAEELEIPKLVSLSNRIHAAIAEQASRTKD